MSIKWAQAEGIEVHYNEEGSEMVLLDVESGYCAVIDMDTVSKIGAVENFVWREDLGL